jgi:hypothetical protein
VSVPIPQQNTEKKPQGEWGESVGVVWMINADGSIKKSLRIGLIVYHQGGGDGYKRTV